MATMNDELYHYGVKGMKWGVRKAADEAAARVRGDSVVPYKARKAAKKLKFKSAIKKTMSALDYTMGGKSSSGIDKDRVARLRALGAADAAKDSAASTKSSKKKSGSGKKGGGGKGKGSKAATSKQISKEEAKTIEIRSLDFLKMFNDSKFIDAKHFKLDANALRYAQKSWGISMRDLVNIGTDKKGRTTVTTSELLDQAAKAKEKLRRRK